jgi:hypothetical protein
MKFKTLFIATLTVSVLAVSCSSVMLTSWKDPGTNTTISNVMVIALFEKLEFSKPFEENMVAYFTSKGLKASKSLDFMAPNQSLSDEELKAKVLASGADAVLVFTPRGADKTVNYTPPTYNGFYRGYYRGAYSVTPGYYTESTTYNVQANLYTVSDEKLIWTGDISATDPSSIEAATIDISKNIYADWVKNQVVVQQASGK